MTGIAFQTTGFQSEAFQSGVRTAVAAAGTQSGISRRARSYPAEYSYQGSIPTRRWSTERVMEMLTIVERLAQPRQAPAEEKKPEATPAPEVIAEAPAPREATIIPFKLREADPKALAARLQRIADMTRAREAFEQAEQRRIEAEIAAIRAAEQDEEEALLLLLA
jgi:hypothetical protein